jgi:ADP-ribose pyrophosphatase YjhB (NUDIX family)
MIAEHAVNSAILRFCPACGGDGVAWRSGKELNCELCGFVLFLNSAAAAGAIIECGGMILLAVRKNEPCRDMLDLPGGFADIGESGEMTARRELREELGIDVGELTYLCSFPNIYPYRDVTYHTLDLIFLARLDEIPGIIPRDDVKDYIWIEPDAIDFNQVAFPSIRNALEFYRFAKQRLL